jgi:hypothetical protein
MKGAFYGANAFREYPRYAAAAPEVAADGADLKELAPRMIMEHGHGFYFGRDSDEIFVRVSLHYLVITVCIGPTDPGPVFN